MRKAQMLHRCNPFYGSVAIVWGMPEIDDLRLTVAAADRENFGAVAREFHVSQSTVSRAVQRVETAIGRELFVREGRTISLHPGEIHRVDALRTLIAQWEQIVSASVSEEREELSIFCTVTASQLIAPALLERFRRARPDVLLDLRTGPAGAAVDAVQSGEVTTAIAPLPNRLPSGLVGAAIRRSPLIAVASFDIRSFDGQTVILSRQGLIRDLAQRWVKASLPKDVAWREAETNEEVLALAALGSGVAIIPELVLDASSLRQLVHRLTPPAPMPAVTVGLVARRRDIDRQPLATLWRLVS